jgi:hypothetical protein
MSGSSAGIFTKTVVLAASLRVVAARLQKIQALAAATFLDKYQRLALAISALPSRRMLPPWDFCM